MNIFHVDTDPKICAEQMCDKHVVKMVIETAQLLSTAHRVVDGEEYKGKTKSNRNIKRWLHPDAEMETKLYKACHVNHPSTIWTRETSSNYEWLYTHFVALCDEYTHRYGKVHMTDTKLRNTLSRTPRNLLQGGVTGVTCTKSPSIWPIALHYAEVCLTVLQRILVISAPVQNKGV